MSDDTRNTPDEQKPEALNLFGGNISDYDPNPTREDLDQNDLDEDSPEPESPASEVAAEDAENGAPQTGAPEQGATTDEEQEKPESAEQHKVKNHSEPPMNDSVFNPAHTPQTLMKAAKIREASAAEPALVGQDAHLLRFNPDSKQYQPKDEEAEATLAMMGGDADIYMAGGGSHVAQPVMWDQESGHLAKNPDGKPVHLAHTAEHRQSITMLRQETTGQKMTRAMRQRQAQADLNGQSPDAKPEADAKPSTDPVEQQEKDTVDPRPMTAGAAVMMGLGKAISKLAEAFVKLMEWIAEKAGSAVQAVTPKLQVGIDKIKTLYGDRKNQKTKPETEGCLGEKGQGGIDKYLQKFRTNPLTPDAVANASKDMDVSSLSHRINERNQQAFEQVTQNAEGIVSDYKQKIRSSLQDVETGMHLKEVGQIPLVSPSDFENRARSSNPGDRKRITGGLQSLVSSTRAYRDNVNGLLNSDQTEGLQPSDRKQVLSRLLDQGAHPDSGLESHQQKIMDYASVKGEGVKDKLVSGFAGTQALLETRLHHANEAAQQDPLQTKGQSENGTHDDQAHVSSPG